MNAIEQCGYVLLADNDQNYVEMAVSLACSLRCNDNKPIALLKGPNLEVPDVYQGIFDFVIDFDPPKPFDGIFTRRFILDEYSPFENSFHVDVDCLLIKPTISQFWSRFSGMPFGCMANMVMNGKVYSEQIDVASIINLNIANGVYQNNWGVFYFEKCNNQNPVMSRSRCLLEMELSGKLPINLSYYSRPGELSDEPFWGIAISQLGIELPKFEYMNMLQVTSPNTSSYNFTYAENNFTVLKSNILHSGCFFHYCSLNPVYEYLIGIIHYRNALNIPLPSLLIENKIFDINEYLTANKESPTFKESALNIKFKTNIF